jgi:hypothetical protein
VVDMVREICWVVFGDKRVERVVRRGVKIATVIAAMPMTMARDLRLDVVGVGCVVLVSDDDWEDMQNYGELKETLILKVGRWL